jgi:hypothetical protein
VLGDVAAVVRSPFYVPVLVASFLSFEVEFWLEGWGGTLVAALFFAWLGLGIAALAVSGSWSEASTLESIVWVELFVAIGAFALFMLGASLLMVGALFYYPARWVLRLLRIEKAVGREFDEDGYRYTYRNGHRIYRRRNDDIGYPGIYDTGHSTVLDGKICFYLNPNGEVRFCRRTGHPLRRVPKRLRRSREDFIELAEEIEGPDLVASAE